MPLMKIYEVSIPKKYGKKSQDADVWCIMHEGEINNLLSDLHAAGHHNITSDNIRYSRFLRN